MNIKAYPHLPDSFTLFGYGLQQIRYDLPHFGIDPKRICCIYRIWNIYNERSYIGQTVNLARRWGEHSIADDSYSALHAAIRYYGISVFKLEALEIFPTTLVGRQEAMNNAEIYWIHHFGSMFPNGYNLTAGGTQRQRSEHCQIITDIIEKLKNKSMFPSRQLHKVDLHAFLVRRRRNESYGTYSHGGAQRSNP